MGTNILDYSIADIFEKKFCFEHADDWKLPSDFVQDVSVWSIDSLNAMKLELNNTKSLLNDKGQDWHEHTGMINKASHVIHFIKKYVQPEILTQAWCKFYEILSSYDLLPSHKDSMRTLHLCEAPGAFISALNYYLCVNHPSINWYWMANTLNPYYEGHNIRNVIVDDRLLFPTLKHWYFGNDNTGDITDPNYIADLCNAVNDVGQFDLVTADGSFDCLDNPGEQELVVSRLHFVEVLIALQSLLPQGCLILKKFTFFECITICQLYLLNCVFEKVHVFKPFTSQSGNSEVYVVCIGFHGYEEMKNLLHHFQYMYSINNVMTVFPQSIIPKSFLQQVEDCMSYFTNLQINAIKENLMLYPLKDSMIIQQLNDLKEACVKEFVQRYHVKPSVAYSCWKLFQPKKKVFSSFFDKTCKNYKSLYFQAVGDTFNNIMKSTSTSFYDKLINVEDRIGALFPLSRKRLNEAIEWQFPPKEVKKRMKSKNFQNWMTLGKTVKCIHNSKFCYPILLYLWNQVSLGQEIDVESHLTSHCYWDSETLARMLREDEPPTGYSIVTVTPPDYQNKNDPLLLHLEKDLNFKLVYQSEMDSNSNVHLHIHNKIVYINTTVWENSLHQECIIKENLTELFLLVLKILKPGDSVILCIQNLLTRYTSGLLFIILSFFHKFTAILPEDSAPASVGQIWIFKNFQEQKWLNNSIQHLKEVKELNSNEKTVLEIVPISSLCDGVFFTYLKDLNNKHLLQRLRSFIVVEKNRIEAIKCK